MARCGRGISGEAVSDGCLLFLGKMLKFRVSIKSVREWTAGHASLSHVSIKSIRIGRMPLIRWGLLGQT